MSNQSQEERTDEQAQPQADQENKVQSTQEPPVEETANPDEQHAAADASAAAELTRDEALAKLALAEAERAQARDDLLRVQAEMQNLRRRTELDVEKAHKYALERFSGELLVVMDNLERALGAAADHDNPAVKAIREGVDLTLKSFADVFRKFSIEAIDPHGEPFDPQSHQAMSMQENPEVEPNTVLAVMQKGYTLHGRVIRPAMVIVAKAPAQANDHAQSGQ